MTMTNLHPIDDNAWNLLIEDTANAFNEVTLNRGFQYYKQGRVRKLSMSDDRHIEAFVQGSERYLVEIDLDFFNTSECDCPVSINCKHIAAVLMQYAEQQGRPVHALANAKSNAQLQKPFKPSLHAKAHGQAAQLAERQAQEAFAAQASRIPEMNVAAWRDWFKTCIAPVTDQTRNTRYVEDALAAIHRHRPSLTPVTMQLYAFNALLFVLETVAHPTRSQSGFYSSYMGYQSDLAASQLQDQLEQCLATRLNLADEPDQWERVIDTLDCLRNEMLTETQGQRYFAASYYDLWIHWIKPQLTDNKRYADERQKLIAAEDELGTALSRTPWAMALSFIHYGLSEDREAWALLHTVKNRRDFRPQLLFTYFQALSESEDWLRLTDWLAELGPMLNSRSQEMLYQYTAYWDKTLQHSPSAEQRMWHTLLEMLPHSRSIYLDKLQETGQWQQWMDYQLSSGTDPSEYRATELQPLEKHAPELLLPFYHQAVERYMLNKNRDSYKAAVKLLKRLAKLYKKLKQEERWTLFLDGFTGRYSRLRALHEELRKGKLIP